MFTHFLMYLLFYYCLHLVLRKSFSLASTLSPQCLLLL
jgi:hypothetical protein